MKSVGLKIITGVTGTHNLSGHCLLTLTDGCHLTQTAKLTSLKMSIYYVTNITLTQSLFSLECSRPSKRLPESLDRKAHEACLPAGEGVSTWSESPGRGPRSTSQPTIPLCWDRWQRLGTVSIVMTG